MKKVIPEDSVLIPDQAERVFKGQIFDVYQWPQPFFDGSMGTFEMLKRPDTVSVIGLVEGDKILVIDDEQPYTGLRRSFPGGRVDETDESIIAAAQREMLEETGYSFKSWRLIKVWQPHTKLEWFVHILLAWGPAGKQAPRPDPGEKITVKELPFEDLKDLVINKSGYLGESTDIFENIDSSEQLLSLPEFPGQQVDL
jgi:8-oxo-dGTP pyrophosphatase MutT (NUDIX family)